MSGTLMEGIRMTPSWRIDKFIDSRNLVAKDLQKGGSLDAHKADRYEIVEWKGNLALNEGLAELIDIIIGAGTPTKWDNTNAYLGVGTSNTAAAATDTGLLGTSVYKAMDSTYPQRSNQTATWRSTYGTSDANQAWEEFTVSNTSLNTGKNLNRKVESKGTKASGETWTLQLQITFS